MTTFGIYMLILIGYYIDSGNWELKAQRYKNIIGDFLHQLEVYEANSETQNL